MLDVDICGPSIPLIFGVKDEKVSAILSIIIDDLKKKMIRYNVYILFF